MSVWPHYFYFTHKMILERPQYSNAFLKLIKNEFPKGFNCLCSNSGQPEHEKAYFKKFI